MARIKYLKYPKKPLKSASNQVKEKFLMRCKEIDRKNAERRKEEMRGKQLDKSIAGLPTVSKTAIKTSVTYGKSRKTAKRQGFSGTKTKKKKATAPKTKKRR
jgi:hypothetical protein